jgi:hypothetical protein
MKAQNSSVSQLSPKQHPSRKIYWMKRRNYLHKHCRIYMRCWWKRVLQTGSWFVGVVDTSMLLKRGLRIFCCLVIWSRGMKIRGGGEREHTRYALRMVQARTFTRMVVAERCMWRVVPNSHYKKEDIDSTSSTSKRVVQRKIW